MGPTRLADPDFYININQFFIGSPRSNRINSFNGLEFDVTNQITAFADISFYHADSVTVRSPISISAPTADALAPMSVDNPYNPYGSRFYNVNGTPNADGTARLTGTPRSITLESELVKDVPPDRTNVTSNLARVVTGFRGKVGDTWNWETGLLYSRAAVVDKSAFYVRESLLHNALMNTDPATAFNPFGYTFKVQGNSVVADQVYHNPASVMSSFIQGFRRDGRSEIASVDAHAYGSIYTLWSGDVSLAFGGEYRKEKYSDLRPPFVSVNPPGSGLDPTDNDFLQFPPAPDSAGHRTVSSFYSETIIPLAAPKNHVPLVKSFELSGSARYERYSDFGNTTKPKVGINWKPVDSVMLRGSASEGFTAPSLPMLYAPTQYTTSAAPGTLDPYRNPVTNEGPYVTRNLTFGNKALKPADSKGKSAGIVVDVPVVKGLSISADYWEISQSNVIGSLSVSQILDSDAQLLKAYTAKQLAAGVPIGQIDLGSGTAAYKGDPSVVRYTPTAADNTAFSKSTQAAVVGQILSIATPFLNLAEGYASGWDLGGNYNLPTLPVGKFAISSDWAYLRKSYTLQRPPNGTPILNDRVNVNGSTRWRGTTTVSWRKGPWTVGFSGYYIGSFADTSATTTQAVFESLGRPAYIMKQFNAGTYTYAYRVHDSLTYNAFAGYQFGRNAPKWLRSSSIRFGVINILDAKPPLSSGATGYPTAVYSLLPGRTWTTEITKRF